MISEKLAKKCDGDIFENSAPVLANCVAISDLLGNRHSRLWSALIDTGADATVIPIEICADLKLSPRDKRRPRGFDPEAPRGFVPRYYVTLRIEQIGEVSLLAYAVKRSYILLGRDFLSRLVLLVDSPADHLQLGRRRFLSKWFASMFSLR